MRISTQHLISPLFFIIGLSISSFVVAEDNLAKSTANSPKISTSTNASQQLVTPRLQDGQAAFNRGNYDLAFSLWQTRATQGHTDAQVFVGLSYANGWGVDKNTILASHWYQKAANSNNASGQFLLGLYLISGKNADLPTGIMWLKQAAKNGDGSAKSFLKKAKRRGWFNNVPTIKQENHRKVETVAMADLAKL